jgi:hypothetical protein
LASTYQWYAFRRIALKYVPFVATSTNGGLYLAIFKDPESAESLYDVSTPGVTGYNGANGQNVMEIDPSVMTAVWQPAGLQFQHTGTELWETFPNGEEPTNSRIQAAMVCLLDAVTLTVNTQTSYGRIWLEYEIDFYVPGPPSAQSSQAAGPSLFKRSVDLPTAAITTSAATSTNLLIVEADEVPSNGMSFLAFNGSSTTVAENAQPVLVNLSTGATTNLGGLIQIPANTTSTSFLIPLTFFSAALSAASLAGTAYAFRLVAQSAAFTAALANIFVKSA